MFGVRPHQDDMFLLSPDRNPDFTHHYNSRTTPAEGAYILDVPNMLMIPCDFDPAPFSKNAIGYMESFYRIKQVIWGACRKGVYNENDLDFICELTQKYPKLKGVFLDDLSSAMRKLEGDEARHKCCLDLLSKTKKRLEGAATPIDIYITWYWHEDPVPGMLGYVEGVSFWTWDSNELPLLRERFEACCHKFAGKKILLGIYMYDFKNRKPVPNEYMALQCNYALELLKAGRIDGIIFEANSVMGVGLPSEAWLRDWIDSVKYTEVPD